MKMGQLLNKFGTERKKENQIGEIMEQCYDKYFVKTGDWTLADFYHVVCETVEEINKTLGSTQFQVPKTSTLEQAYQVSDPGLQLLSYLKHEKGEAENLKMVELEKIVGVVAVGSGLINCSGAKYMIFPLYGVPAIGLFIKACLVGKLIPDEVFIPLITSATVLVLAKLNKI